MYGGFIYGHNIMSYIC